MNNDLISRSTLKENMKSRLSACNEWIEKAKDKETKIRASAVKAFIAEVIMTIDNAPTVTPTFGLFRDMLCSDCEKRPQGEWYKTGQSFINPNKFRNYGCSNCFYELDEHIRIKPNFCPNCGADMRGDKE